MALGQAWAEDVQAWQLMFFVLGCWTAYVRALHTQELSSSPEPHVLAPPPQGRHTVEESVSGSRVMYCGDTRDLPGMLGSWTEPGHCMG